MISAVGTINLNEVVSEGVVGAATGALMTSKLGDATNNLVIKATGLGSNGGVAHVANTQMTKLANGTTNSITAKTGVKIASTIAATSIDDAALNSAMNVAVSSAVDKLPEASFACSAATRECGQ